MKNGASIGGDAVEIVPKKLYAVGGCVALDGRISWAPADAGYQPVSGYLLIGEGDEESVLIDTGLGCHEADVVRQLKGLIAPQSKVSVFLSRAEDDCTGNLGAILRTFDVGMIYAGGQQNPFDAYEDATAFAGAWGKRTSFQRLPPGKSESIGDLEVISPALRLLATSWFYDPGTRTLFTSDAFGHTSLRTLDQPRIVERAADDLATPASVRSHVLSKFWWLEGARVEIIAKDLESVFQRYDVDVIAPGHGVILRGKDVIARHRKMLQDILAAVGDPQREGAAV